MRAITILFSLIIAAVAVGFLLNLSDLVPYAGSDVYFRQPAFFPSVMLGLLVLTGLGLAGKCALGFALPVDEELGGTPPHFGVLLPLAAVFAAYAATVPFLGYLPATLLFAIAAPAAGRHLRHGAVLAMLLLGLSLYVVFVVYLDVWFRGGDLPFLSWFS